MAPSASDAEIEKPTEFVSVKFLLKQVYAAHMATVKEYETEIQDLKQQLESSKQAASAVVNDCKNCKQMEIAYTACKEEYKNAVLEQTRRLKEFESIFDINKRPKDQCPDDKENIDKDYKSPSTIIDETMLEFSEEALECGKTSKRSNRNSDKTTYNTPETDIIPGSPDLVSLMPPPKSTIGKTSRKSLADESGSEMDDFMLVPDTMEDDFNDSFNRKKKQKNAKRTKESNSDTESSKKHTTPSTSNGSKKRALCALKSNDLENKPTKENVDKQNKTSPLNASRISPKNIPNAKRAKFTENNGRWAENFKDFGIGTSAKAPPPLQPTKVCIDAVPDSEDDFDVTTDDNGVWKKIQKKKELKKVQSLKPCKSTSRFGMTFEPLNPGDKKNYKQTTLSESVFMSKSTSKDKSAASDKCSVSDCSSVADASALASIAKGSYEAGRSVSLGSETFCPLHLLDEHASEEVPPQQQEVFIIASHSKNFEDKNVHRDEEEEEEKYVNTNDSFNRIPVPDEPNYKYKEDTVRNKMKRKQLNGFDCKECEKYYTELGLSDTEKKDRMKTCSRHRAKHAAPSTPAHFWEIDFPNTEVCKARGYIEETQKVKLKSRRRRPLASE